MSNNYIILSSADGEVGVTLGNDYRYFTTPVDLVVVYMTVSPSADDSGCTVDLNDDGTDVIAAVDCSDQNVPGRWISTHFGGAQTPVKIAAGSLISFDANSAAADTRIYVQVWALPGSLYA